MKKWIKSVLIFSQIFGFSLTTYGQDDLLDLLETKQEEDQERKLRKNHLLT